MVQGDVIELVVNGWDGREGGRRANRFLLRSAKDGAILRESAPPLQDGFVPLSWFVSDLRGREVYFEAVDGVSEPSFAWVGLASVAEKTKAVPAASSPYRAIRLRSPGTWAVLTRTGGSYSAEPYLSSLGEGEPGIGEISSPAFTLTVSSVRLKVRGWDGRNGEVGKCLFTLIDANTGAALRKSEPPLSDEPAWIEWDVADLKGRSVRVRLIDSNADTSFAWMGIDEVDAGPDYRVRFADTKSLAGWQPSVQEPAYAEISGVPFLAAPSSVSAENGSVEVPIGCEAKHIFLLGMTTSLDQGNYTWYPPNDYSGRFFIGDSIGAVNVVYADGTTDHYPLVLGEGLWWGMRFTRFPEPFVSDAKARKALAGSLRLFPNGPTHDGRYLAVIAPRAARIRSIEIVDSPAKRGVPVIFGLTVESTGSVPDGVALPHDAPSEGLKRFVETSPLRRAGDGDQAAVKKLAALREALYTTESNFPKHSVTVIPKGYTGPEFGFTGDSYAEVLTNILYANLDDIAARVDAEGMYHTSAKGAASWGGYEGFGTYRDGVGSYYTQSWTRDMGRSLSELCAFGYVGEAKHCADYVLRMARVWEERPDLRLNGVQLPRHICRVLQGPSTEPGQGCFENDGHGLTTLFIYNLWRRLPDRDSWLRRRWPDVRGLGDWVVWQMAHPDVSGFKVTLRTDSECAGGTGHSVYADVACFEALRALADMADSIGESDSVDKWRAAADLLSAGCESSYLISDKSYGETWTLDSSGWPNRSTVMGPVIIPADRSGFLASDPWRAYNEAAYKRQVESYKPLGYFGVAMGYGQGFVTQSALLLDKMHDATTMLQWAAKQTYCSALNPYIVPEGCEIDPAGKFWHRTGDLGNGVQQAEIVKALRVVIGIDDTSRDTLTLCPRMPYGWTSIRVRRYPLASGTHVSYLLKRLGRGYALYASSDRPLPEVAIRLGPFDSKPQGSFMKVERSGDSWWVSVHQPAGKKRLSLYAR